jgi:alpha-N-arabinofuranosidase
MKHCAQFMDGLSIHYYTVPGDWSKKGGATVFSDAEYYLTVKKAVNIAEIIDAHLKVMDKYDPEHKVDMIIDEWGTWFDVEEGTNPGFLYQQNTMRDAIVAAVSLDIFNARCSRISMTNIAQIVNVLQSVILTEGDKMVLTPTYHVYDLYKRHHDAECLTHSIENASVDGLPQFSATASRKDGELTLTVSNASLKDSADMSVSVPGLNIVTAAGRIITNEVHAHNTFEAPETVIISPLGVKTEASGISFALPACSVAEITMKY